MHNNRGLTNQAPFHLLVLLLVSLPLAAHESRPIYIELTERAPQSYQLQWKTPPSLPDAFAPAVAMPDACQAQGPIAEFNAADGMVRRGNFLCRDGLSGQALVIEYPGPNPSVSSLVRYSTLAGERHTAVLSPEETAWTIPKAETAANVARDYLLLGIEHIWSGIDHLLFLVCLLWVAGTWRRILITITGFTVAHSITLIASALQLVRLPVPPVEATIALSIIFLATEIAKGRRDSLTWRHPITVSSSFGLLHGFGFAAALGAIGLPQTELLTGLLFFNLGVEVGQIIFAAGVITLILLTRQIWETASDSHSGLTIKRGLTPVFSAYAVGTTAVFWFFNRCLGFMPSGI